jgi:hypothetical protein
MGLDTCTLNGLHKGRIVTAAGITAQGRRVNQIGNFNVTAARIRSVLVAQCHHRRQLWWGTRRWTLNFFVKFALQLYILLYFLIQQPDWARHGSSTTKAAQYM